MSACPANTPDKQAKKRARRRYPARPDADGFYVRGQKAEDGTWTPMPCSCAELLQAAAPATRLTTAEEGVQHELDALHALRATWRNLAPAKEVEKRQKSISRSTVKGEDKIGVATAEGQQPMAKILKRWRSLLRVSEVAASEEVLQSVLLLFACAAAFSSSNPSLTCRRRPPAGHRPHRTTRGHRP